MIDRLIAFLWRMLNRMEGQPITATEIKAGMAAMDQRYRKAAARVVKRERK